MAGRGRWPGEGDSSCQELEDLPDLFGQGGRSGQLRLDPSGQVGDAIGPGEAEPRGQVAERGLGVASAKPGGDGSGDVWAVALGQRRGFEAVIGGHRRADQLRVEAGELAGLGGGWDGGGRPGERAEAVEESGRAQGPPPEGVAEWRGWGQDQAGLGEASVGGGGFVAAVLAPPSVEEGLMRDLGSASGGPGVAGVARPLPGLGPGDEAGTDGVEVDVAADGPVIGVVLDHLGLVSPLEEVSGSVAMACGPCGVGGEERLHAAGEVGAWRPEEDVEVVGHDDEAEDQPSGPLDGSLEVVEEASSVVIVMDDILAGVSASHDVVDCVVVFDAESSGHGSKDR